MVISEALYLRTGCPVFLERAKRWSRGAAILFAVGAVSGTVVSFELGLLWPGFMEKSGAIDSMFIRVTDRSSEFFQLLELLADYIARRDLN
jgi:cytochrome bd-type quinol oxidase subunit 1